MGLDVVAVSRIQRAAEQDPEDYDNIRIWKDSFEYCELEPGNWEETDSSRSHSFRAGSYSGYNHFRDLLCRSAIGVHAAELWENIPAYLGKPFLGLIVFSDCEGFIGPKISAILHKEFVENRERCISNIKDYPDLCKETGDIGFETEFNITFDLDQHTIDWFIQVYDDFTRAFELAKDGGVVRFC